MERSQKEWDGTPLSRYECKYLVSPPIASEIRRFISPFMVPDRYARDRAGYRYPISSLYLDTDDLHLYWQTVAGELNRFKLRARSYSDDPASPIFLEVKRRVNDVIIKRRVKLERGDALAVLTNPGAWRRKAATRDLIADLACFAGHVDVSKAKPFLRVRYEREAYESMHGDPLRLTLDTDVAWHPTARVDLGMNGSGWLPTPMPGLILEIKFTDTRPSWVGEMIRTFDLYRQSVAKYVLSVDDFFVCLGGRKDASPRPGPGSLSLGPDGRPAWIREV